METKGHELDEDQVDSAIADLLGAEMSSKQKSEPAESVASSVLPELPSQESMGEDLAGYDAGLTATLRQKWAELCGAA
ncbi:hypothetical protein RUA4292_03496 [Ruegeria atlantica]|uniref:Uncharacterized protein n=2 Tax=Ruegeria atlantica TaxID=81569 RepID=A0A0N7LQY3_9RHOB|nr:hypothetical protein RUA4292_03496 [Ruegeria atlantica]